MISFDEFKKLLGRVGDGKTDAEIEALRQWEYRFADAALDWWKRECPPPLGILVVDDGDEIRLVPTCEQLDDDFWHMWGEYNGDVNEIYAETR